ncbi:exported hypothetical protein [metagenome]|uniref:Lipoprotein n=1 Tax=metagenome TaxID=256318 RepID=A0A2P2CJ29_9ZZZZ
MTSRAARRRHLAAGAGLAVLTLTAGCASGSGSAAGDPGDGGPTSSASTSSAPVPVPTSSAPVVEPADGGRIKVPGASMRALSTYKHLNDFGIVQGWNDGQSAVTFTPSLTRATSLDAFAKEWIREHGGPKVQKRQEDAVAGGKYSAWHVVDTTSDKSEIAHRFGIMFLDSAWLIDITIYVPGVPETLTEDEQQAVIDSLLASFKTDLD